MCRYRTGQEMERNRRLAACALLVALLAGCGQKDASQQAAPPPPAVGVQLAAIKGVTRSYEFVGRIQAIGIVALRARVEGFLDKVLFREGQDVKTGDLLYQIEKAPYQALVDQARANVAAAQATAINAELQYNRSLELLKKQFTPQATVDQDKAALDTARAQILQTQAALAQAQINLGYTDIRAPIDGRIGRTAYTQGNLVNAASGVLATIVSQDPIYALFPVSEQQLEDIRQSRKEQNGQQIKIEIVVRFANGEEYPLPGIWNYTDVQVNQQTDTQLMRATLPNPDRQLTDGQYVTVVVRERKEQPRLVVPQAALQVDQAGSYVLIVDSADKVELRRVTLGPNQGTDVVVASGLKEGDRVIVDGVQKVRPDQTVKVTVLPASSGN
jgi:membrane fusion protein (multidrug efflux system)